MAAFQSAVLLAALGSKRRNPASRAGAATTAEGLRLGARLDFGGVGDIENSQ